MNDRVQKVNQNIKKQVSEIIQRQQDFTNKAIVTVTRVDTSSNMIHSKVWISVIPDRYQTEVIKGLNKNIYDIQQQINKRLNMRPVPKIKFMAEEETKRAARVEEILKDIDQDN
jgi:ribosome-binding factor A